MSFYVTLPSNASMDIYPNNKIGQYVTKLKRPLNLLGEWEVALVEIMYPATWIAARPIFIKVRSKSTIFTYNEKITPQKQLTDIIRNANRFFKSKIQGFDISIILDRNEISITFNKDSIESVEIDRRLSDHSEKTLFKDLAHATSITINTATVDKLSSFYIYSDNCVHMVTCNVFVRISKSNAPAEKHA